MGHVPASAVLSWSIRHFFVSRVAHPVDCPSSLYLQELRGGNQNLNPVRACRVTSLLAPMTPSLRFQLAEWDRYELGLVLGVGLGRVEGTSQRMRSQHSQCTSLLIPWHGRAPMKPVAEC